MQIGLPEKAGRDRPPGSPRFTAKPQLGLGGPRPEIQTFGDRKLQAEGAINCGRGRVRVLDRARLEERACECYAVVKKELARLLSDVKYRQDTATASVDRSAPVGQHRHRLA